jgi:hypothetical protein
MEPITSDYQDYSDDSDPEPHHNPDDDQMIKIRIKKTKVRGEADHLVQFESIYIERFFQLHFCDEILTYPIFLNAFTNYVILLITKKLYIT